MYVFLQVIESPLAKATVDTSVATHWLAVEGVQPAVPESLLTEGGFFTCPVRFIFLFDLYGSGLRCIGIHLTIEHTLLKPILQSHLDCSSIFLVEPHDGKKSDLKEEELPYDSKAPTKHVISRDLQVQYLRMKLCNLY